MWLGRLDIYCLKSKDHPFDIKFPNKKEGRRSQLCWSPIRRFTEGVSESQSWHCGPQRSEPFGCDGGGTSVDDGGFIGVKVM